MATHEEISHALDILHVTQKNIGRPGSRLHQDGIAENNALRNALTHPCCGSCECLDVTIYWGQGRDQVNLKCRRDYSPRNIWFDWTPPDEPIRCIDCTDPEGRP